MGLQKRTQWGEKVAERELKIRWKMENPNNKVAKKGYNQVSWKEHPKSKKWQASSDVARIIIQGWVQRSWHAILHRCLPPGLWEKDLLFEGQYRFYPSGEALEPCLFLPQRIKRDCVFSGSGAWAVLWDSVNHESNHAWEPGQGSCEEKVPIYTPTKPSMDYCFIFNNETFSKTPIKNLNKKQYKWFILKAHLSYVITQRY